MIFNAYIDGFNLYKGALEKRNNLKWLDLNSLCRKLMPEMELGSIYYFTAPLKNKFPDDKANERQHAYWRVISDSGIQIIKGKFLKNETTLRFRTHELERITVPALSKLAGLNQWQINRMFKATSPDVPKAAIYRFEEKGSDVNLASYLLRDVYKYDLKAALVITADSDLLTPIKFALDNHAIIKIVIPGDGLNADQMKSVSPLAETLNLETVRESQFSNPYIMKKGSLIYKPKTWV